MTPYTKSLRKNLLKEKRSLFPALPLRALLLEGRFFFTLRRLPASDRFAVVLRFTVLLRVPPERAGVLRAVRFLLFLAINPGPPGRTSKTQNLRDSAHRSADMQAPCPQDRIQTDR